MPEYAVAGCLRPNRPKEGSRADCAFFAKFALTELDHHNKSPRRQIQDLQTCLNQKIVMFR